MKLIPRIATLVVSIILSLTAFADSKIHNVIMSKISIAEDPGEVRDNQNRRRIPMCPVECLITEQNGISFASSSLSVSDIIAFEICDSETEVCVMSFYDEDTFVENLFSLSGDFQLIFKTKNYKLIGYVSM